MIRKRSLQAIACLCALLLLLLPLASCATLGSPLLTLEADGKKYTYSVNLYELHLSALKGNLVAAGITANGLSPTNEKFWKVKDSIDGKNQTLNEYYLETAMEECKYALVGLYLFDKYKLSLSEAEKEKIEQDLDELIKTDGEGSKTALNRVLADYGVNFDMMRQQYTNKVKISAVQNYLYTLIGENIKEAYLNENYVHFNQIFLASYHYEYETDKNGDVIYYDADGKVLYKETSFKETVGGVTVYYTDSEKTAYSYDTENGAPAPKINSEGTDYKKTPMTEEELEALANRANLLATQLADATLTEFNAAVLKESDDKTAAKTYTDGYYIKKTAQANADYANAYATLLDALSTMKTDEVRAVKSENGYHIVMKLDNTKKAYELDANAAWFESFASGLAYQNYREECEPYLSSVKIDEAALEKARDMSQVPVNYFYY